MLGASVAARTFSAALALVGGPVGAPTRVDVSHGARIHSPAIAGCRPNGAGVPARLRHAVGPHGPKPDGHIVMLR